MSDKNIMIKPTNDTEACAEGNYGWGCFWIAVVLAIAVCGLIWLKSKF